MGDTVAVHAAYLTPNCGLFEAVLSGLAVLFWFFFGGGGRYLYIFFLIWPYVRYEIIWATRMKALTRETLHSNRGKLSLKWWQLFFFLLWLSPNSELSCLTNTSNHPEVLSLLLSGYCWPNRFAWHNTAPSEIKKGWDNRKTEMLLALQITVTV